MAFPAASCHFALVGPLCTLYGHQRALNRTLKRRKVNSAGGLIKTTYNSRDSGTYRETQTHTQEQTHTHPGSDTCVCWLSERAMVTHSYTWEQPEPSSLLIVFSLTSSSFPVAPLYRSPSPFPFSLLRSPFSLSQLPLSFAHFLSLQFLCPSSLLPCSAAVFAPVFVMFFVSEVKIIHHCLPALPVIRCPGTACPGTGACLKSPRAAFRFHYTSKSLTHLCSKEHISCRPLMRRDQCR